MKAEDIARLAHMGQTDKQGEDYILHVERVAKSVPLICRDVAWLHDVLEDCLERGWDEGRLSDEGIDDDTIRAVRIITRQKHETYAQFIDRICNSESKIAIKVKIADIDDHLSRGHQFPEMMKRYQKARPKLVIALES